MLFLWHLVTVSYNEGSFVPDDLRGNRKVGKKEISPEDVHVFEQHQRDGRQLQKPRIYINKIMINH